jgi:hypothetical protein
VIVMYDGVAPVDKQGWIKWKIIEEIHRILS